MFTELEPELVSLTPKFAKEFSEMPCLRGDRDRNSSAGKGRVRMLTNEMQQGAFYTPVWATARLGDTTYRVNGGHSSMALAEANGYFPKNKKVLVMKFVVSNENDLVELFHRFDRRGSVRTERDNVKAHQGIHDQLAAMSTPSVNKAISGIAFASSQEENGERMTMEMKLRFIHKHIEFIVWTDSFTGAKILSRNPVVAAMFLTWNKDKKDATAFWTYVRDESHPDNQHPTRKLATFLRDSINNNKVTKRELLVRSLHAWNAYRSDSSTRLKYHEATGIPKVA